MAVGEADSDTLDGSTATYPIVPIRPFQKTRTPCARRGAARDARKGWNGPEKPYSCEMPPVGAARSALAFLAARAFWIQLSATSISFLYAAASSSRSAFSRVRRLM